MKSTIIPILFLVIVSLVLIVIWFLGGRILASGESAIPFYNFTYLLYSSSYTWTPSALGFPSSYTVASVPFYFINNILHQQLQSGYFVQAIQFFILLTVSAVVISKYIFQQSQHKIFVIFASLFYLLNLFIIPNLWGRLQYPYLYFYAFLPVGFYLISKALDEKRKISIFLFIILTFLFSLAFASIPLLELFWMIQGLYLVFFIIIHYKDKKKLFQAIILFLGFLLGWILVNFWWFYQFFIVLTSTTYITGFYSIGGNTTTLLVLSERLGNLSYVFRLMHRDFFIAIKDVWGPFYLTPFAILLSYVLPFFAFAPLLFKKKPRFIYFFLGLSLLIIFLMKGSNEPFGVVSLFVFTHIRFLEAFRNAFEKFGLALPFAYAPLVGYTSYVFYEFIKKKYSKRVAITSLTTLGVLIFGVLIFPMWNSWVYSSPIPPANNLRVGDYVAVPDYYHQANSWLKSDTSEFRNVALPIGGEGITYTWDYGYSGVELSNSLFDKPYISLSTTIQFLDTIASQLENTLFTNPDQFTKVLSLVGAKYVMTRSDIDFKFRNMTDPSVLQQYIVNGIRDGNLPLTHEKTFDSLSFYKNNDFIPLIYPAKNIHVVKPTLQFTDALNITDFQNGEVFINPLPNNKTLENVKSEVTSPDIMFTYSDQKSINLEEVYKTLPYIRFLPSSSFYDVIRTKEKFDLAMQSDMEKKFFQYLILIDKRLVELRMSIQLKNQENSLRSAENYHAEIKAFQKYLDTNKHILTANLTHFRERIENHDAVLKQLSKDYSQDPYIGYLRKAREGITTFAKLNHILPVYPVKTNSPTQEWNVYQFTVNDSGQYEVFMTNPYLPLYFDVENSNNWELNDRNEAFTPDYSNTIVHLGSVSLNKGFQEIKIPLPPATNLLTENATSSGIIRAQNRPVFEVKQLKNIDRYAMYTVSYAYKFEKGGCADMRIETVSDKTPLWKTGFGCFINGSEWETKSLDFIPHGGYFTDARVILSLDPKGKSSEFHYKDLRIEKKFPSSILLRRIDDNSQSTQIPSVTFKKINPTKYAVHVKNASDPFQLVFLSSYHPLWKATFVDDKTVIDEDSHYLANSFANAWYIDRKGTYDMEISFVAEDYFTLGKIVSGGTIIVSIGAIIFYYISRKLRRKK